jgi:tRNA wybutosine-synthesizing protein 3
LTDNFLEYRQYILRKLKEHLDKGLVDSELSVWLLEINKKDCLITTSSCSGRVTLHSGVNPLDKKSNKILASWHDPRQVLEACNYHRSREEGLMWLALQPPIVHFITPNIDIAMLLVRSALKNGMRRSCIRPSVHGWQVEIRAGDKSLYYFNEKPDCSIIEKLGYVLSIYKGRFSKWMDDVLKLLSMEEKCGS